MAPPASFGKYLLTDKLATGGMAEIYRGKLLGPGGFEKQLVIKQIHPELARHQQFVEMFVAEAKTTVGLSHGNIVPVYELGVVDGTYFIAMEFVDGVTLADLYAGARAAGKQLGAPMACYIVSEILKGLDYAHRKGGGIIHRDLSTRNVMVSRDGEVKILDFGLAATLEGAAAASAATSGGGRPVGSFPYMSPEQAARAPIDPRTDLFTCGILLWEMVTGRSLFARGTDEETIAAVREGNVPAPSTVRDDVPPELEKACLRALERDPAKRFPDAGAFLGALGRYLYRLEPGVTPSQLAQLVATLCPPRVRAKSHLAVPVVDDDEPTAAPQPGGPPTRPMERKPRAATAQQSFATSVVLTAILERTPPAPPPPPAAPTRDRRLLIAAAASLAIIGGIAFTIKARTTPAAATPAPGALAPSPVDARPASASASASASDARLAPPPDAAPSRVVTPVSPPPASRPDAAPRAVVAVTPPPTPHPDAAPRVVTPARPPTPTKEGTLRLGVRGAPWATVELDGRPIGRAPLETRAPVGRHDVVVKCDPEVCPPTGLARTVVVDIAETGVTREVVDLSAAPR